MPTPIAVSTCSMPGSSVVRTTVTASAPASLFMLSTITRSGSRFNCGASRTSLISAEARSHAWRRCDSSYSRAFSIAMPAVAARASTSSWSSAPNAPSTWLLR